MCDATVLVTYKKCFPQQSIYLGSMHHSKLSIPLVVHVMVQQFVIVSHNIFKDLRNRTVLPCVLHVSSMCPITISNVHRLNKGVIYLSVCFASPIKTVDHELNLHSIYLKCVSNQFLPAFTHKCFFFLKNWLQTTVAQACWGKEARRGISMGFIGSKSHN